MSDTTVHTKTSERSYTVENTPGSVVKQVKPRIVLDILGTERTVASAGRLSVDHDKGLGTPHTDIYCRGHSKTRHIEERKRKSK